MKRSNDSFLMRMLILALFWLSINFIFVIIEELKTWNLDVEILNGFNLFESYKYFIIPIIGLFVYFGIHVYSKNNSYINLDNTGDISVKYISYLLSLSGTYYTTSDKNSKEIFALVNNNFVKNINEFLDKIYEQR